MLFSADPRLPLCLASFLDNLLPVPLFLFFSQFPSFVFVFILRHCAWERSFYSEEKGKYVRSGEFLNKNRQNWKRYEKVVTIHPKTERSPDRTEQIERRTCKWRRLQVSTNERIMQNISRPEESLTPPDIFCESVK